MNRFTNSNILKEKKRIFISLMMFVLVLCTALLCWGWRNHKIKQVDGTITDLYSLTVSANDEIDKKAYVDIAYIPYRCVSIENSNNSYYIVNDGEYMYIALMDQSKFNEFNHDDIKDHPQRAQGYTKKLTNEVKEMILEVYNDNVDQEYQILKSEFDDYFGSIYLNMVMDKEDVATFPTLISIGLAIFGVIGVGLVFYEIFSYKYSISKLDEYLISQIDMEMNMATAEYYQPVHMYLTNNYLINFKHAFKVMKYEDIAWIYVYEKRVNGLEQTRAIKVVDNNGKRHTIAKIRLMSKKQSECYDEIFNTVLSKNSNVLIGYTDENIKEMNNRFNKNYGW